MKPIFATPYPNLNNFEIHNESFETCLNLDQRQGLIQEILSCSVAPIIQKKYIFTSPIVQNSYFALSYKVKLVMDLVCNIEFTSVCNMYEPKLLIQKRTFVVLATLPKVYVEGDHIHIVPTIIDVSYDRIAENTLYLSSFISFKLSV